MFVAKRPREQAAVDRRAGTRDQLEHSPRAVIQAREPPRRRCFERRVALARPFAQIATQRLDEQRVAARLLRDALDSRILAEEPAREIAARLFAEHAQRERLRARQILRLTAGR